MATIEFDIYKVLGTLSETPSGRKKQVTCISWNGKQPKFDIRTWNDSYTTMSKGITLTLEEMMALRDVLNGFDLDAELSDSIEEFETQKK